MSTTSEVHPHTARLQELLAQPPAEPGAWLRAVAAERQAVAGEGELARAVDRAELEFLAAERCPDPAMLAARARTCELDLRCLAAAEPTDPAALFDLAELAAECRSRGLPATAAACQELLTERVPLIRLDERLHQEAVERYAALQTEGEDLDHEHRVAALGATAGLLDALGARGDPRLCTLAARLRATADERRLLQRLERVLTPAGAAWLERISFALLLVVLGLVVVDLGLEPEPARDRVLLLVDAGICLWFIAEFALKLSLAPRRGRWFVRNALTDLLPAVPAVLFLLPMPAAPGAGDLLALRALRLFRIAWAARYVQALRPLLRLLRLLLLLVRGMDGLVQRFAPLLNRDFVFFEPQRTAVDRGGPEAAARKTVFAALRAEHALLRGLPQDGRQAALAARGRALAARAAAAQPVWPLPAREGGLREIPVETAVEFLWRLQPDQLQAWLARPDVLALDRVVRVLSAPLVRSLPVIRRLAVRPLPATAEERVVAAGRRVADWLDGWQQRLQFLADLHGIVTGPQILDRVATAMVTASQRPAVRLLLFGGLFLLLDLLIGDSCLGDVLQKIVGLPLVVLGSVCLVFLTLGRWLKRIAGEAAETFRLTSEAHFASLLELAKVRHEGEDLAFLGRRVFTPWLPPDRASSLLRDRVHATRRGIGTDADRVTPDLLADVDRTALLYLHFLDGGILHHTDVQTTEQLLANPSLENLRRGHLAFGPKDRKRLRALRLDEGSIFAGPYLWFRFITESIAVETARRVNEYNRRCLTLQQAATASAAERAAMAAWLESRRDPARGRTLGDGVGDGIGGDAYRSTMFDALDFLAAEPDRDRRLLAAFGDEVVTTLRIDRSNMIRQIFGARPLHRLPRSRRSFNLHRFYNARLSLGRVFLVPLYSLGQALRSFRWVVSKVRATVREVLDPELALRRSEDGRAPFAVALRKIQRMKAPGLLEAIRTRVRCDPVYSGAPPGWTTGAAQPPELERDLDFLLLRERERAELREQAAAVRARAAEWHAQAPSFEALWQGTDAAGRADGELALTVAWVTDLDDLRGLCRAGRWAVDELPRILAEPQPGTWCGDLGRAFLAWLDPYPVDQWLHWHRPDLRLSRRQRRRLRRAFAANVAGTGEAITAWNRLRPGEPPAARAAAVMRAVWRDRASLRRDLLALRAVQSLSVLDVRNYRDLVFRLGDYAADGESVARAVALP